MVTNYNIDRVVHAKFRLPRATFLKKLSEIPPLPQWGRGLG